jgi:prepilin-type N-terminal cleavage/methylation domain-containing protein
VSRAEGGYTLVELIVVMAILGIVLGAITSLFVAGINADADQSRRFGAQQEARTALDKMRREIHAACTVSNPATYNTAETSITLYFSTDNCTSGTHTVSWCTSGSGSRYGLYRIVSTSCTGATAKFADYLTSAYVFTYLPPGSHVTGLGAGAAGIVTQDASSTLPRLHLDLLINRKPAVFNDRYRLVDDIAFRNGPRACASGVASC